MKFIVESTDERLTLGALAEVVRRGFPQEGLDVSMRQVDGCGESQVSTTYECPTCGDEINIRKARAL